MMGQGDGCGRCGVSLVVTRLFDGCSAKAIDKIDVTDCAAVICVKLLNNASIPRKGGTQGWGNVF
jgi:hypothetical protein